MIKKRFFAGGLLAISACVYSGSFVLLQPCDMKTCKAVAEGKYRHAILTQSVSAIKRSGECASECSLVKSGSATIHVVGNWKDVSCYVWGGNNCRWSEIK